MAFDVVMFGTFSLPERNVEEWLTSPIERAELPWLDELDGFEPPQDTPEALLSALEPEHLGLTPHELFSVRLEGARVTIACYASEETYRQTSVALALLVGSAAAFGATGELHLAGYQGIRFAERLTVRHGRAVLARLSGEALGRLEQHPSFVALDQAIHARFDALVGRGTQPAARDPRRTKWAVSPFTGRKVRVSEPARQ